MSADGESPIETARSVNHGAPDLEAEWPVGGLVEDVADHLAGAGAGNQPCVLVTLARVEGHAPRRAGAQLLVRADGSYLGFVAGGCIEAAVAAEATALFDGEARKVLVLGRGSPLMDLRLPCGSRLELLMERVEPGDLAVARLMQARRHRCEALWLSATDADRRACVERPADAKPLSPAFAAAVADASRHLDADIGGVGPRVGDEGAAVWRRYTPRRRLLLAGGDPVVLALARLAETAGWEVVVSRTRGPDRAPDGFNFTCDPARAQPDASVLDRWTAVVAATHDLDDDHAILCRALRSPSFYVGALGSRSRLGERYRRLAGEGLVDTALGRLHAPVGGDTGAAPYEIALAILAEASAAWRRLRRN